MQECHGCRIHYLDSARLVAPVVAAGRHAPVGRVKDIYRYFIIVGCGSHPMARNLKVLWDALGPASSDTETSCPLALRPIRMPSDPSTRASRMPLGPLTPGWPMGRRPFQVKERFWKYWTCWLYNGHILGNRGRRYIYIFSHCLRHCSAKKRRVLDRATPTIRTIDHGNCITLMWCLFNKWCQQLFPLSNVSHSDCIYP